MSCFWFDANDVPAVVAVRANKTYAKLYQKGVDKMNDEFDIHHIVKSVRKINVLMSLMLDKHQTLLTRYLPDSLIKLETSKKVEDNDPVENSVKDISKNPLDSIFDEDFKINNRVTDRLLWMILPDIHPSSEVRNDLQVNYYSNVEDL